MPAHDDSLAQPRWPFRAAAGLLLLLAAVLFGLSYVGLEFLKRTADGFSGSGNAEVVTPEFYAGFVQRLRLFALVIGLLALPLALLKDLLNSLPARGRSSGRRLRADARWYLQDVRSERRGVTVSVVLLIALGVFLRAEFLNQPLRFDEGRTFLSFVQMPFAYIPLRYNQPNNHILNTVLVKVSTGIFGESEWAIRLPAFACGCLVMPLAFLALKRVLGTGAALVLLALIATSSPLIEFSTNARGYMLVMCAFLGMILFGPHAVRERSLASWTWTVVCGVVGAMCIPIMLLPAASVFLWLAFHIVLEHREEARGQRLRDLLIAGLTLSAITLLFYAPAMAINGPSSLTSNEGVEPGSIASLFRTAPAFFGDIRSTWHRDYPDALSAILVGGAVLAVLFYHRIALMRAPLHLAAAAVVLLYLLAISDFGWLRVWLFLVPVYLGLVAAGLHAVFLGALRPLGRPAAAWGAVFLALGLAAVTGWQVHARRSILLCPETGVFPAAEAAVSAIEAELQPGDVLVLYATNATQIEYYARRHGLALRPIGDYANARWFHCGGTGAEEPGRAWFVVNPQEGYRYVGVDYLVERPPPWLGVFAPPSVLLASAELELYRAPLERRFAADGSSFPGADTPR